MAEYSEFILEATREKLGYKYNDTSHDDEVIVYLKSGKKMSKSSTEEFDKDKFWELV